MDDRLAELLGGVAVEIAAERGIPLEEATQIVRERLPWLRARYHAASAPYGEDDAGFAQWLVLRAQSDPVQ